MLGADHNPVDDVGQEHLIQQVPLSRILAQPWALSGPIHQPPRRLDRVLHLLPDQRGEGERAVRGVPVPRRAITSMVSSSASSMAIMNAIASRDASWVGQDLVSPGRRSCPSHWKIVGFVGLVYAFRGDPG